MARKLTFTVARDPIDLELGGDHFDAPPLLAPTTLGTLLDLSTELQSTVTSLGTAEAPAIDTVLRILANPQPRPADDDPAALNWTPGVFDLILTDVDSADRFRTRLYSKDRPFDLAREVVPAIGALIEEYTDRPLPSPSSSSTSSRNAGTSSTDGAPPVESTPYALTPAGS
jgi:hypothetical protein